MNFFRKGCSYLLLCVLQALFFLSLALSQVFDDFIDPTRDTPELSKEAQQMQRMLIVPPPTPIPDVAPGLIPEEAREGEEPIVTDADTVEYIREENIIVGKGNAIIRYKGMRLLADMITVYLDTNDAFAE